MAATNAALIAELRDKMRAIESGGAGPQEARCSKAAQRKKACRASAHDDELGAPSFKRLSSGSGSGKAKDGECDGRVLDEQAAFHKIERLLRAREHPRAALLERLVRDGYSEEVARSAVDRAARCGLVSDERFADVLVRSRLSQGKGLQGIASELERLEIDPWSVDAYRRAADGESGPDELARALDVLTAKPPRSKRPRDAAFRKLMQKGFGADVASSAARIWHEEHRSADDLA